MAQPKHKKSWFLDGRDDRAEPEASTEEMSAGAPDAEPTDFSKRIGRLLNSGRRKAVAELHEKGIATYGWKDDRAVVVKPKKA